MTPSERSIHELEELKHRLYGGALPGETGDIPEMRASLAEVQRDIAAINGTMTGLAGFYKNLTRTIQVAATIAAMIASVYTIAEFVVK